MRLKSQSGPNGAADQDGVGHENATPLRSGSVAEFPPPQTREILLPHFSMESPATGPRAANSGGQAR